MASSDAGTSSGKAGGGQYQVFLNFHGRDTRLGFTSFLYRDLTKNGIHAFMDDEELRVGEEIGEELPRAIDDSRIYIPIFSKNYADSKWCLRELERMVNNTTTKSEEKKIMPVFYDVEPDDVALKTPSYRTTIAKHKKEFPHEAESWEEALKKVDKIKGWVLPKCKNQAELVDLVVEKVLQELKIRYKSLTENLVGLDDRVAEVLKLLDVDCSDEVRLLGIHGMGGIGKTTIAGVIYNELSSRFGKHCAFLDAVRETSKEGLVSLQKKLLKDIDSSGAVDTINDADHGRRRIEATLGSKKVLIVLDDIDEEKQIENLTGQHRLYPGTRIIITTRNASVLEFTKQRMALETKDVNFDPTIQILPYEMVAMNFDDALLLFKRHTFREGSYFDDLSRRIVSTTGCLPLALEVIGSSLRGKDIAKWENTLNKLKNIPDERVQEKLMISYKDLNYRQQEIFLDVACFFINEDITNAKYMWEACEFYPELEIDVLVRKSLIKIKDDNNFWMHDQLRDLGREIVRRKNPKNFEKQSRVWTSEEFLDFIRIEERYEDVEALDLWWRSNISISHEEIRRFKSLRFLRLSHGAICGDFTVSLPKLRWISWRSPPPDVSVPSMHSKNLVVLEFFNNSFTDDSKVWDLIKMATKLKNLTLVKCCGITRTPDLSKCLDLERLTFDNCERLKEIDNSIGKVTHLHDLDIINCNLVEHVPDEIGGLVKLERFSLRGCYKVSILPTSIGNLALLRKLDLSSTKITSLSEFIGKLRCLSDLILYESRITEIPSEIEGLVELRHLRLGSMEIKQPPDVIGKLKSLCTLDLTASCVSGSNSSRWVLPIAIGKLEKLEELCLGHRIELEGEIPCEIGYLSSLRVLDLRNTKVCRVPGTINMLSRLSTLILSGCDEITDLPELPASLVYLRVKSSSLKIVPNLSKLTNLENLSLSDRSENRDPISLEYKCELRSNLTQCDLGWIGRLSKLKYLSLDFLNFTAPALELGLLSLLEYLTLRGLYLHPLKQLPRSLLSLVLHNFSSIGLPLSNLKVLSYLNLHSSPLQEIQLNGLSRLQSLSLIRCELRSLSVPSSLRTLRISSCRNMIEIQFLGMSASLENLSIYGCWSIERIVSCSEVESLGVLDQSKSSSIETTYCSPGVFLLTNAFNKLKELYLLNCENLLEIQVIGTLLPLQRIDIGHCNAMEKISGISNLKELHYLEIHTCPKLWVVEGLDKLEFLTELLVYYCPSLETLFDISNLKIPDECKIKIAWRSESDDDLLGRCDCTFKEFKRMAQLGALHSEKNKEEAKMEGDAKEPGTELQPQFHPSASSQDHKIGKEPPIDNVKKRRRRKRKSRR